MQMGDWAVEHSQALRELLTQGMTFSQAARTINARFGTAYTRNAAIGRSKRMGLTVPSRPKEPKGPTRASTRKSKKPRETKAVKADRSSIEPVRTRPFRLRSVGITPRLLSLHELAPGDCRYPYGGDKEGETITFCGHPRLAGASYCAPHFELTRGLGTPAERAVAPVILRLVRAA